MRHDTSWFKRLTGQRSLTPQRPFFLNGDGPRSGDHIDIAKRQPEHAESDNDGSNNNCGFKGHDSLHRLRDEGVMRLFSLGLFDPDQLDKNFRQRFARRP
jgi:hypothetical protein